jgi:coproporphyrinogen III oxidase
VTEQAKAYCPIIVKHVNDSYTEEEKRWQQLRRGR